MKKKVLFIEDIDPAGKEYLKGIADLYYAKNTGKEAVIEAIKGMDAVIIRSSFMYNEAIEADPELKIVQRYGIGLDRIDVDFCTKHGVFVGNTPTANLSSVVEHTIMMILAISRKLCRCDQDLRTGKLSKPGISLPNQAEARGLRGNDVSGKTLGIVGYGKIGRQVAEKMQSMFDMKIIAYDPYLYGKITPPENTSLVKDLDVLMKESDYVSLHMPSTPETVGMIGERELSLMKPTSFIINCARGGIIVDKALNEALKEHKIAGAAIDVFSPEPPAADYCLFDCENAIFTPHMAAVTEECLARVSIAACKSVAQVLQGEYPDNIVNRKALGKG